jgi:pyruvate,water dikinase
VGGKAWVVDDDPNERFTVWTRGNVGEVFPDVVSPLTWSMFGAEVEKAWRDALGAFGALRDADYGDVFPANVGCFGGYCYLNVSTHRIVAVRTPGLTPADMDRSIFGESDAPPYRPAPGDRSPIATARVLRTVARTLFGRGLADLDADRVMVDAWLARQPDPATATDAQLRRTIDEHRSMFRQLFGRHIHTTFRGTIPTGVLTELCTDRLDDPGLVVRLLGGIGEVDSAEPLVDLWKLARDGGDLAAFRRRHGYRGVNEWEGSSPTWDTDDDLLQSAVDAMRRADPEHDPRAQAARLARERAQATEAARARLGRGLTRRQFDLALRSAAVLSQARERSKATVIRAIHGFRLAARELARRAVERGAPTDARTLWLVTRDELDDYLADPPAFAAVQQERAGTAARLQQLVPPFVFVGTPPDPSTWPSPSASARAEPGAVLQGIAGGPGVGRGRARIVHDPADAAAIGPGDVLVAPITDPAWTPLFVPVEAVVVDVGAQMSHAVIVSRELGIPCVVSVTGATTAIADGALVEVDGTNGTVTVLESAP